MIDANACSASCKLCDEDGATNEEEMSATGVEDLPTGSEEGVEDAEEDDDVEEENLPTGGADDFEADVEDESEEESRPTGSEGVDDDDVEEEDEVVEEEEEMSATGLEETENDDSEEDIEDAEEDEETVSATGFEETEEEDVVVEDEEILPTGSEEEEEVAEEEKEEDEEISATGLEDTEDDESGEDVAVEDEKILPTGSEEEEEVNEEEKEEDESEEDVAVEDEEILPTGSEEEEEVAEEEREEEISATGLEETEEDESEEDVAAEEEEILPTGSEEEEEEEVNEDIEDDDLDIFPEQETTPAPVEPSAEPTSVDSCPPTSNDWCTLMQPKSRDEASCTGDTARLLQKYGYHGGCEFRADCGNSCTCKEECPSQSFFLEMSERVVAGEDDKSQRCEVSFAVVLSSPAVKDLAVETLKSSNPFVEDLFSRELSYTSSPLSNTEYTLRIESAREYDPTSSFLEISEDEHSCPTIVEMRVLVKSESKEDLQNIYSATSGAEWIERGTSVNMFTKDEESQVEVAASSDDEDSASSVFLASTAGIISALLGLMVMV